MLLVFQWRLITLIFSRTETLSGHNPLTIGSKAILLQCRRPYEWPKWPLSLNTIICSTIINLLNDIETGRVQYLSWMLKKGWIKPMSSIYNTQIRMHFSIKVFFLLIYSVAASTCMKNGKLTALEYQYSDGQVRCYTWCFSSALQLT